MKLLNFLFELFKIIIENDKMNIIVFHPIAYFFFHVQFRQREIEQVFLSFRHKMFKQ